ncbi:hypothetical protein [Rhodothermus marinus]|jgi:hypothetical protein|uniref:hypothetical protein n=1 Tax=Rhodothermus marinus TaxID=29549 RepID=UPI0012DBDA70|nr:hypothetical protein [Rhodothermus marinus]
MREALVLDTEESSVWQAGWLVFLPAFVLGGLWSVVGLLRKADPQAGWDPRDHRLQN